MITKRIGNKQTQYLCVRAWHGDCTLRVPFQSCMLYIAVYLIIHNG